eukprot:TRINITY_DN2004_c0_g1_i1.p1 TRINITY_DN2004_c0_g1~~TRINITY_DN2004_c0_g1_i1.p1  ORF type:complete len:374 (+),score=85.99 TRINITY_DN2004_c0_g1_i1:410-1531(+)
MTFKIKSFFFPFFCLMFKNSKYSFKKSSENRVQSSVNNNTISTPINRIKSPNPNLPNVSATAKMESFNVKSPFRESEPKMPVSTVSNFNQLIIPHSNDVEARKNFLNTPLPIGLTLQCRIIREKSGAFGNTKKYYMYCERPDEFLISAEYRSHLSGSSFVFFDSKTHMDRDSNHYIGKLRKGRFGNSWVIYDHGESPKNILSENANVGKAQLDLLLETKSRAELGLIVEQSKNQSFLANQQPFGVDIYIPNENSVFKPKMENDSHSLENIVKNAALTNSSNNHFHHLYTKQPTWNEERQVYSLSFNGRVTRGSIKNFQVTMNEEDRERLNIPVNDGEFILQFGKTGKDSFILDFSAPFTPLQAFSLAMLVFEL